MFHNTFCVCDASKFSCRNISITISTDIDKGLSGEVVVLLFYYARTQQHNNLIVKITRSCDKKNGHWCHVEKQNGTQ